MSREAVVRRALMYAERARHNVLRLRSRAARRGLAGKRASQLEAFERARRQLPTRWAAVRGCDAPEYTTPAWQEFVAKLSERLMPDLQVDFLNEPVVRHTMVFSRGGKTRAREYALLCAHFETGTLDRLLPEDAVGDPPVVDVGTITSGNTIHHLFHLARFQQATGANWADMSHVVEWGGGYGNQAKLARRLIGDHLTYTIIDLPLFTAIQWAYLGSVLGEDAVALVERGGAIQEGKVNLVPAGLVGEIDLAADLFVSTWALSESTHAAQDYVVQRDWFGAGHLLLAHQRSSSSFPSAERLAQLAITGGARHEAVGVVAGSNYAFR